MAFLNEQGLGRLWAHIIAKLGNKVDKENGKGLSTNDYTDEEKNKLASVSGSIENLNTLVGDTNVSTQIGNAINAIDYPVDSVNGKTGEVTLSASDVGALPDTYTIPTASSSDIGGVKVGNGLLMNNGSLSVDVVDNLTSTSTTKSLSAAQGKALNDAINSITTDLGNLGAGDMLTATYDKDKDGIVDNAAKLEGHSASYFATASALEELDGLVGDKAVSTQINDAITELDLENTYASIHTHPYIESNKKGSANGVAELDANGKVPSTQLPSYVDDVLEYSTKSNFPSTGESGKIYVDTSVNKTYRWGGSSYVEISASLALGETSSTAYRGDYGKTAYTHSQITDGNPHGITCAKISAVPTSRTVNGKALSANIALSAGDVGADVSGAADTALTNAKAYTDAEITEWVGDKKVSEQINSAIASKSDNGHTHDDRYYTEGEIDTKLSGKANSSHGNHVPATETANNAKFLRNDNTWQTVTPANIGAAASSHGTHVTYSTTPPVMDGTASVGTANNVARGDHKHPTDTSRAAASELTALKNLVGDTAVSTQIANAIVNKSDTDHTHSTYMMKNNPNGTGTLSVNRRSNTTVGDYSTAVGFNIEASGISSHAEGSSTTASGGSAHAEGSMTTASGSCAHSEGQGTTASGESSHAEGNYVIASGYASHAEGDCTNAASDCQHVQGKNNIVDTEGKYAHIVGNGESDSKLSNAHTLDWDGNAWFAGNLYLGGTSQDDALIKGVIVHNSTTSLPAVTNGAILIAYDA